MIDSWPPSVLAALVHRKMVAWKYVGKYMRSIPNLRGRISAGSFHHHVSFFLSKTFWGPPSSNAYIALPNTSAGECFLMTCGYCFEKLFQDLHVCYDNVRNHHNLSIIMILFHSGYVFEKSHENAWICSMLGVTSHATLDSVPFPCLVSSKPNSASNSCNRRRLGKGGTCIDLHTIVWRCWQKSCTRSKSQCSEVYKATKKRRLDPWRVSISNSPESLGSDTVWGLKCMLTALFCLPDFFFARLGLFWGSSPMSSRTPANLPMHGQTGVWTHDPAWISTTSKWPNWQDPDFNIFPSRTETSQSQDQTMSNNQTTTSGQALGFGVLGCT